MSLYYAHVNKVWDAATGRELIAIAGHDDAMALAWSPDGTRLVTVGNEGKGKVWEMASGRNLVTLSSSGSVGSLWAAAWSPDGKWLATAGGDNPRTRVWDAATGQQRLALADPYAIYGVAWSPDNKRLATASVNGDATIWDVTTGQKAFVLPHSSGPLYNIAWSPDGHALCTASSDGVVSENLGCRLFSTIFGIEWKPRAATVRLWQT
jgi:WD40 repeat protein